jgi:hypothetical protein
VEKGRFHNEYFSPVKIPVIEHTPWVHKNLPIPSGILHNIIKIFKDKSTLGIYEHFDASYRSHWFTVLKKSGALRLVHDLQPLNAVTIRNSGITPIAKQVIEAMAGRACYSMLTYLSAMITELSMSPREISPQSSPLLAL